MPAPSLLLLVWCGLAATCTAATVGALAGTGATAWSLIPGARSRGSAFGSSLLAGVLVFPLLYGIIFELLGRADVGTGLLLGTAHAAIMFAHTRTRENTPRALHAAVTALVYAVTLAFLYVTP